MSEKPLHVSVALALGWELFADGKSWSDPNGGRWAALGGECHVDPIPRYDTDWNATGPLIERFHIDLASQDGSILASHDGEGWIATCAGPVVEDKLAVGSVAVGFTIGREFHHCYDVFPEGVCDCATPLIAVCNLILALHAAGKLT